MISFIPFVQFNSSPFNASPPPTSLSPTSIRSNGEFHLGARADRLVLNLLQLPVQAPLQRLKGLNRGHGQDGGAIVHRARRLVAVDPRDTHDGRGWRWDFGWGLGRGSWRSQSAAFPGTPELRKQFIGALPPPLKFRMPSHHRLRHRRLLELDLGIVGRSSLNRTLEVEINSLVIPRPTLPRDSSCAASRSSGHGSASSACSVG